MDYQPSMMTCRFCGKHGYNWRDFVKYGVRHYAHNECFVKLPNAAERLRALHDWQIKQILRHTKSSAWPVGLYVATEHYARRHA